jgi:putative ABC transport system ATP-binding protein
MVVDSNSACREAVGSLPTMRRSPPAGDPIVRLEAITRRFDDGHVTALDRVDLAIAVGEIVAVTGPSGCGKSTLLNLIAGLDLPSEGVVIFAGRRGPSPSEWTEIRAGHIGISFQDFNLLPTLTARENVEVAMFGRVVSAGERCRRARRLLADVGIGECEGRLPQQMSGGERRRTALARSLANSPDLLLVDEPTSNLDSAFGRAVADLLLDLCRTSGTTLVVVTHDVTLFERCDRRIEMLDGRIVGDRRGLAGGRS